ncbi:hypothetical protein AGLY_001855 [Aphis glycines]|uniref:Uncharacterized protein n=1 Tax=Aphis glycines TaxID=307491 RepID=A0A6G0U4J2_APHGL|nr:hypothetical protein AGLY_001855 [Aphis glycines]
MSHFLSYKKVTTILISMHAYIIRVTPKGDNIWKCVQCRKLLENVVNNVFCSRNDVFMIFKLSLFNQTVTVYNIVKRINYFFFALRTKPNKVYRTFFYRHQDTYNCLFKIFSMIDDSYDSERSEECIDFTMIITSRNNAPISNYGGGFRCKSEYPWCIIELKFLRNLSKTRKFATPIKSIILKITVNSFTFSTSCSNLHKIIITNYIKPKKVWSSTFPFYLEYCTPDALSYKLSSQNEHYVLVFTIIFVINKLFELCCEIKNNLIFEVTSLKIDYLYDILFKHLSHTNLFQVTHRSGEVLRISLKKKENNDDYIDNLVVIIDNFLNNHILNAKNSQQLSFDQYHSLHFINKCCTVSVKSHTSHTVLRDLLMDKCKLHMHSALKQVVIMNILYHETLNLREDESLFHTNGLVETQEVGYLVPYYSLCWVTVILMSLLHKDEESLLNTNKIFKKSFVSVKTTSFIIYRMCILYTQSLTEGSRFWKFKALFYYAIISETQSKELLQIYKHYTNPINSRYKKCGNGILLSPHLLKKSKH